MAVRLPERGLAESILYLAAPLLEAIGPAAALDDARSAIEVTINVWNANVPASKFWGCLKAKPLAALRQAMRAKLAPPGAAALFDVFCERWREEFALDPRLVETWTYSADERGQHRSCARWHFRTAWKP